jgi:hypothetical protein
MLFVAQVVWGKDVLSWSLGLGVGAIATFWMWVRDSPPAHIEHWRTGRDAERRTAKALDPLAHAGWAVAHDVASCRGNLDHILVGPGGVFLVDTKDLGGVARVQGDVVCVERPDNPRGAYQVPNLANGIRGDAARLSKELRRLTGERVWVNAVVVFWNDFPAVAVEAERVAFIGGCRATSWFDQQPERLSRARVDKLRAAVAALRSAA